MVTALAVWAATPWLEIRPDSAKANGKRIVLLAGDEEYRSEEALPQLAQILAKRHGFHATVLFSVDERGSIDPTESTRQPGLEHLAKADLCVLMLRFRRWPDADMAHFVRYFESGKPILALRTSTHAFAYPPDSPSAFRRFSWDSKEWPGGFGRQVLGETWVSHWGIHGQQATRAFVEPTATSHPVVRGVGQPFGTTDVYEAHPPPDAQVLLWGEVVSGLNRNDPPAEGRKATAHGDEQELNDPKMPVAWLRTYTHPDGKRTQSLTMTMGSATDFLDEGLRRFVVNGARWLCRLSVPRRADVTLVGEYRPSPFGFGGYRRGVKPSEAAW